MLNWIYADKDTLELKYGNRTQSCEHIPGPWDWRDEETTVVLEKRRGFFAVKEEDGSWALYFDRHEDELLGVLGDQAIVVPVRLNRSLVEPAQPDNDKKEGS